MSDDNKNKYTAGSKKILSHVKDASHEVIKDMRRDGGIALPSKKDNLYHLQGGLVIILALIALFFLTKGTYMTVGGSAYNISDVFADGFQSQDTANAEFGVFFTLLISTLVFSLVGLLRRKWVKLTSILGIIGMVMFLYVFSSDKNNLVSYFSQAANPGLGYHVPNLFGYVILALFVWIIIERRKEVHAQKTVV